VIAFSLSTNAHVELTIFNLLGKKVRTLVGADLAAGDHSITWDGLDEAGNSVASGVYLYRLQSGSFVACRKMILMH
jgi:flagellar hook assembly protein FlgD